MTYLARALPAGLRKRFVLTDKAEDGVWDRLGIIPIRVPDGDYCVLYACIRKLAEYATRGVLDWQHLISELARKPPSEDDESIELLNEVFTDEIRTRFFTDRARHPAWIGWLDERGHLNTLFRESGQLDGQHRQLARWLADGFALQEPEELWLLIGRHRMSVHPDLWCELARSVGSPQNPPDKDAAPRWISVLLTTAPDVAGDFELQNLADRCIESQAWDSLIDIFEIVTAAGLRISRFPEELYRDFEGQKAARVHAELDAASDHYRYVAEHIWENGLKPNLDVHAERLLVVTVTNLEAQHRTLCTWGSGSRAWDPLSHGRHAIGLQTHARPEIQDVVIDAARDCLAWFASNDPRAATRWCNRLASADAPTLRRLAIHNMTSRPDVTHDATIDWLLEHSTLYDWCACEEVLYAWCSAYPHASNERRTAVVQTILAYRWPRSEDEDHDRQTVSYHFSWLEWIVEAAPECSVANHALEDLRTKYPDFNLRISPRLHHPPEVVDTRSPWKTQDLMAQPPSECIDGLLTFERKDPLGPERAEVLRVVRDAASRDFDWGMGIVDALVQRKTWDSDLWAMVLTILPANELDGDQCRRVLQVLSRTELCRMQARLVASVLEAISRNDEANRIADATEHADSIAIALWRHLDEADIPQECENYWMEATNRSAGILAEYWMNRFAYWRKQSDDSAGRMDKCREVLSTIMSDQTTSGKLGRSVLACHCAVLLAAEEEWTREHLIPRLLDDSNGDDYKAIWHGFLCGSINTQVAEVADEAFLRAVARIDDVFSHGSIREMFIRVYMTMFAFHADDPVGTWIPRLFRHATEDDRHLFIREIEEWLGNMNDAQRVDLWERWIRCYLGNRIDGIPDGLKPRESGEMLRWLRFLHGAFHEAVDLTIRMPESAETHYDVTLPLSRSELPEACSDDAARLLIYLGACEKYGGWFMGKELADRLLRSGLPQGLEVRLKELVARQGWR